MTDDITPTPPAPAEAESDPFTEADNLRAMANISVGDTMKKWLRHSADTIDRLTAENEELRRKCDTTIEWASHNSPGSGGRVGE
jgi:hypothetical protein